MIDPTDELEAAVAKGLQQIGGIAPSPATVHRIRMALLRAALPEARPSRIWWPKLAAAVPLAVVLIVVGTLTALAAPSALPDSPLYGVRNAREALEIQLAGSPAERATLYVTFAQQRADQVRRIAKGGSQTVITSLLHDITKRVDAAKDQASKDGAAARATLQQSEGQIEAELTEVQTSETLPPAVEQQLDTTIQDVQSSESTNAAEPSPAPEATSAPAPTASAEGSSSPEPTSSAQVTSSPDPTVANSGNSPE